MRRVVTLALTIIRWWFGVTYVLAGIGALIAAPIMVALGDWGGVYMAIGGPVLVGLGWPIHPWGLQRTRALDPFSAGST